MSKSIKFVGDGSEYLPGIPARDLTEEDIRELGEETIAAALAFRRPDGSPLYEAAGARAVKPSRGETE